MGRNAPELLPVHGLDRRQQVDRRHRGIVGLPVGDPEPDSRHQRIGVFSVARLDRRERYGLVLSPPAALRVEAVAARPSCRAMAHRSARTVRPLPDPPTGWSPRTGRGPGNGRGSRGSVDSGWAERTADRSRSNWIDRRQPAAGTTSRFSVQPEVAPGEARQLPDRHAVSHRDLELADALSRTPLQHVPLHQHLRSGSGDRARSRPRCCRPAAFMTSIVAGARCSSAPRRPGDPPA